MGGRGVFFGGEEGAFWGLSTFGVPPSPRVKPFKGKSVHGDVELRVEQVSFWGTPPLLFPNFGTPIPNFGAVLGFRQLWGGGPGNLLDFGAPPQFWGALNLPGLGFQGQRGFGGGPLTNIWGGGGKFWGALKSFLLSHPRFLGSPGAFGVSIPPLEFPKPPPSPFLHPIFWGVQDRFWVGKDRIWGGGSLLNFRVTHVRFLKTPSPPPNFESKSLFSTRFWGSRQVWGGIEGIPGRFFGGPKEVLGCLPPPSPLDFGVPQAQFSELSLAASTHGALSVTIDTPRGGTR